MVRVPISASALDQLGDLFATVVRKVDRIDVLLAVPKLRGKPSIRSWVGEDQTGETVVVVGPKSINSAAQIYLGSTVTAGLPLFKMLVDESHTAMHADFALGIALGL